MFKLTFTQSKNAKKINHTYMVEDSEIAGKIASNIDLINSLPMPIIEISKNGKTLFLLNGAKTMSLKINDILVKIGLVDQNSINKNRIKRRKKMIASKLRAEKLRAKEAAQITKGIQIVEKQFASEEKLRQRDAKIASKLIAKSEKLRQRDKKEAVATALENRHVEQLVTKSIKKRAKVAKEAVVKPAKVKTALQKKAAIIATSYQNKPVTVKNTISLSVKELVQLKNEALEKSASFKEANYEQKLFA